MPRPDGGADPLFRIEPDELFIEDTIGEGTTATVYLARYQRDGAVEDWVALKEIHSLQEDLDISTLQAVHRELRVLSQVEHPNIMKFMGLVNQREPLRLVLEYCRGGSLFELLHNCYHVPLSWQQRLTVLQGTADGADYLHTFDPPIVHRDLKSLNLMLKEVVAGAHDMPEVKLADFGFARPFDTAMTQGVGTKHWMAPEVLQGTEYTERADIFSFAMVAYEVLYRLVPFERYDPTSVAGMISQGKRPELDVPEAPPRLLDLIRHCWDQNPANRPSFGEIAVETKMIMLSLGEAITF